MRGPHMLLKFVRLQIQLPGMYDCAHARASALHDSYISTVWPVPERRPLLCMNDPARMHACMNAWHLSRAMHPALQHSTQGLHSATLVSLKEHEVNIGFHARVSSCIAAIQC